jgi:sialic acid synthase SpsE
MQKNTHIVAELAQGFEGSYVQARLLVKASASAAKFQLVYADELATPDYKYYDLFRSLEMPDSEWQNIADYAKELGIELYLDIFGNRSLQLCSQLGLKGVKLHGTDISNIALLNEVARSPVDTVFLGAGGAYLNEIESALRILNTKNTVIILGFQGYPTPVETNHIKRISFLQERLSENFSNFTIGFADHEEPSSPLRYAVAASAVGAGAQMIEKHLTLGRIMKMEDHESALNPDEFFEFANVIRNCTAALGIVSDTQNFGMTESEEGYRKMILRHVVASRNLSKSETISPEDVTLKRTSADSIITDLNQVYQKKLNRDIAANTAITLSDIN